MTDKTHEEFSAWYLAEVIESCGPSVRVHAEKNLTWVREDGSFADPMLRLASLAWHASRAALLKKQIKEQEEFLDHLADFEPEDTFHD